MTEERAKPIKVGAAVGALALAAVLGLVGCTSVVSGDGAGDAAQATSYKADVTSSIVASSSAAAAASAAAEAARVDQANVSACGALEAIINADTNTYNTWINAWNTAAANEGPLKQATIDALGMSLDKYNGINRDLVRKPIVDKIGEVADATRDLRVAMINARPIYIIDNLAKAWDGKRQTIKEVCR